MIILRAIEAEIIEGILAGHELDAIREQIQKKPRYFRNTINRMVDLDMLEKVELGYSVKIEKYTIRPDSEVTEDRKKKTRKVINKNVPVVGEAALALIRENYSKMYRSALLKLLQQKGYKLTKFELNLIILNEDLSMETNESEQSIA